MDPKTRVPKHAVLYKVIDEKRSAKQKLQYQNQIQTFIWHYNIQIIDTFTDSVVTPAVSRKGINEKLDEFIDFIFKNDSYLDYIHFS